MVDADGGSLLATVPLAGSKGRRPGRDMKTEGQNGRARPLSRALALLTRLLSCQSLLLCQHASDTLKGLRQTQEERRTFRRHTIDRFEFLAIWRPTIFWHCRPLSHKGQLCQ